MGERGCGCSEEATKGCGCSGENFNQYWCDICQQVFNEKRCPQCGQKLKKIRT